MERLWLYRLGSLWLFMVNAAAGAVAFGSAYLYNFLRSTQVLRTMIQQSQPSFLDFVPATIGVTIATFVLHILLGAFLLVRNLQRYRRHIRVSVIPSSMVAPGSPHQEIVVKPNPVWKWWQTHSLVITRVRMLTEVAMQTFQAHKSSQLVASTWINRLMAVVIVTNCWFSICINRIMRKFPLSTVRVVRLIIDSCLDLAYCIVIPVAIITPYIRVYQNQDEPFPWILYYDDTWYANAASELRQIFVTTWMDYISKFVASLGLLYRLYVVDGMLAAIRWPNSGVRGRGMTFESSNKQQVSRSVKVLDVILCIWGLVVAMLHVHSSVIANFRGQHDCLLEMRPWASNRYSCACFEISCTARSTSGNRGDLDTALAVLNPPYTQVLIFANCPMLEVPTAITTLRSLVIIKVYNSTVVSWNDEAALTESSHPNLQLLFFIRSNMSAIPSGLLSPNFPRRLWDFEFSACNLTTLPSEISVAWRNVFVFVFEGNQQLTEFPTAVAGLSGTGIIYMGLTGIEIFPDDAIVHVPLTFLVINGSPIKRLPAQLGGREQLVDARGTSVSSFPPKWNEPRSPMKLYASDTPLCNSQEEDGTLSVVVPSWVSVDCEPHAEKAFLSYPIEDEDRWRRHKGFHSVTS